MESQHADIAGEIGIAPVCRACGSELVVRNAWARWSPEYGLWELENVFEDAFCRTCERAASLVWKRVDGAAPWRAIRELNDRFRREGLGNGSIVVTPDVQALGPDLVQRAFAAVRSFEGFSEDKDPCGEHDFGAVDVDGQRIFWKIDPYDPTLTRGSYDPANEACTYGVLTIMLASEY